MKIFRFDQAIGKPIDKFGSKNLFVTPIMRLVEKHTDIIQVVCMHLCKDGVVGGHEASIPQLFVVVNGEGWVSGEDQVKIPIREGQLAYWKTGEWHQASTKQGMTAIVIESDQLEPIELLQEISN